MPLTLLEASKQMDNPIQSAIVEMYAASTDILGALQFLSIGGSAMRYNREETLPGVGFRGVNEGYGESVGVLNPITEPLVIAGGDLDVDRFIVQTMGAGQRGTHENMKVKSLGLAWSSTFINGNSTDDPRVFDGLKVRLVGDQLKTIGTNGDALSLIKLDEMIDAVDNPTHLIMNKSMRRRLSAAARTTSVAGNITYDLDAFGRRVTRYNDIPILIADVDNAGTSVLPFTETLGNKSDCTSIYCVSFMPGMLSGIQNGPMDVRDLGELENKPALRTRIEWYSGLAVFHGRAAARLAGIRDVAVVA